MLRDSTEEQPIVEEHRPLCILHLKGKGLSKELRINALANVLRALPPLEKSREKPTKVLGYRRYRLP